MEMLVIVDGDIHAAAMAVARRGLAGGAAGGGKLYAPLDDDAEDWFMRLWDATEAAILHAREKGKTAARDFVRQAGELATAAAKALGQRYEAVKARVAARLNDYLQTFIDAALARVRPVLSVGGQELRVMRVSVAQRLMVSGSAKASLEEVCAFVAEGELTLSVEYGLV